MPGKVLDYSGQRGRCPKINMTVCMSYTGQVVCRARKWYVPPENTVGVIISFPEDGFARVRWEANGVEQGYCVGLYGQFMLCEMSGSPEQQMVENMGDVRYHVREGNDATGDLQAEVCRKFSQPRAKLCDLGSDELNSRYCRITSVNEAQHCAQIVLEDSTSPGACGVQTTVSLRNVDIPYRQGKLHYQKHRYQDAIHEFHRAKAEADVDRDVVMSIGASQYLLCCYLHLGDFSRVIELGRWILENAIATADWSAACAVNINLSDALRRLGDAASAALANDEATKYARMCGDEEALGKVEYNLAILHEEACEWELALDRYRRSLAAAKRFDDAAGAAFTHQRMSRVHIALAKRLRQAGPAGMGTAAWHEAEARQHAESALQLAASVDDVILDLTVDNSTDFYFSNAISASGAGSEGGSGCDAAAVAAANEGVARTFERLGMQDCAGEERESMAWLFLTAAAVDPSPPPTSTREIRPGLEQPHDPPVDAPAALCEAALHAARRAARHFEAVLERVGQGGGDAVLVLAGERRQSCYGAAQLALWALGRREEALAEAERGRARSLLAKLRPPPPAGDLSAGACGDSRCEDLEGGGGAPTWAEVSAAARAEGAAVLYYSAASADALLVWVVAPDGRLACTRKFDVALALRAALPPVDGLRRLRSALPPRLGERLGEEYVAAVLGCLRSNMAVQVRAAAGDLPGGADGARREREATEGATVLLAALREVLVAPVWAELRRHAAVVVVPTGPLHLVPWAALLSDAAGRPSPLRIRVAPSLRVLAAAAANAARAEADAAAGGERRRRALVVGNPLPLPLDPRPPLGGDACGDGDSGSEGGDEWGGLDELDAAGHEIAAVKEALPHILARLRGGGGAEIVLLQGEAASKAAVVEAARGADWVHLACHALADPCDKRVPISPPGGATAVGVLRGSSSAAAEEGPAVGGPWLVLGGEGWREALLGAEEVAKLELAAGCGVVLSSCGSARGAVSRGEGVVGPARALVAAGAAWVVGTLWPVGDRATEELMGELYRRLAAGAAVDEALRAAQAWVADGGATGATGGGRRALMEPDDDWDAYADANAAGATPGAAEGSMAASGSGVGGGGKGVAAAHWAAFVLVGRPS